MSLLSRSRTLVNRSGSFLIRNAISRCQTHRPDWSNQSHSLAITASAVSADLDLYLVLNAYWEPLRFELSGHRRSWSRAWRRWADTFLEAPDDICPISNAPWLLVNPRSIAA